MEKFAVDLDKVLDDFELQEDQTELFTSKNVQERNGSETSQPHTELPIAVPLLDAPNVVLPEISRETGMSTGNQMESIWDTQEENNSSSTVKWETETFDEKYVNGMLTKPEEHSNQNEELSDQKLTELHSKAEETLLIDITEVPIAATTTKLEVVKIDEKMPTDVISSVGEDLIVSTVSQPSEPTVISSLLDQDCEEELEMYLEELEKEEEHHHESVGNLNSLEEVGNSFVSDVYEQVEDSMGPDENIQNPSVVSAQYAETMITETQNQDHFHVPSSSEADTAAFDSPVEQTVNLVHETSVDESTENAVHLDDVVNGFSTAEENVDVAAVEQTVNCQDVENEAADPYGDDSTASLDSETAEGQTQESTAGNMASPVEVEETPVSGTNLSDERDAMSAAATLPEPYSSLTDEERMLGILKPVWIPDEEAAQCMNCAQRFTVLRRRHHCRACGRVLCAACCSSRARLEYMESREARVCLSCLQVLKKVEAYKKWGNVDEAPQDGPNNSATRGSDSSSPSSSGSTPASSPTSPLAGPNHRLPARVNPNNPSEYCSTIPPHLQAAAAASLPPPSVLVPVGVLKKEGSSSQGRNRNEPAKQVIFSDGIRPGGDLASELDSWRVATAVEPVDGSQRSTHRKLKALATVTPPVVANATSRLSRSICPHLPAVMDDIDSVETLKRALADSSSPPVTFVMQSSQQQQHMLKVSVKLLQLDCCVRRRCWSFTTEGMRWVSQDELVILLEQDSTTGDDGNLTETLPPADVFFHLLSIYEEALIKRHVIVNLGHTVTPGSFLGSTEHGGFLFFRTSFQCVQLIALPTPPYLVGILLQRWEIPWAKVFPLRLLLRLGAEFRYYPTPLFSVRHRKPVFGEIGHTIINLLADMRNFSYTLPAVPGLVVHMEERETNILLPRSRYQQICKALAQSNDHVLSLAASFSPGADAHLVCLQLDDGSYQTQAINIHTKPRRVTGASFVVFNGALKSSSGLSGRSSIVEDGVMVQLLPETLEALKQSIIRMENFVILCGKTSAEQPEETVSLKWVDQEPSPVNSGVVSPIDGRSLSGVSSIRVMQPRDYKGDGYRSLRWSELFIIQMDESGSSQTSSNKATDDTNDITRLAEMIAKAACTALATKIGALASHNLVGLRLTMDGDSVEYQAGADNKPLASSCTEELDSSLIPLLHQESATQSLTCVIELWFRILHV